MKISDNVVKAGWYAARKYSGRSDLRWSEQNDHTRGQFRVTIEAALKVWLRENVPQLLDEHE